MGEEVCNTLLVDSRISMVWRHRLWLRCVSVASEPYVNGNADLQLDAILSFATIALALRVPRMKDARSQQVAVIIWGTVIVVMYSFLMNVFRGKNQGYPFWLPPFF